MEVYLLLMIQLTATYSGADFTEKVACIGESIVLAGNISLVTASSHVSLYVNGENQTLIAMWMNASTKITEKYSHKVTYDEVGNLWIHNINISDEAKYIILHETGITPKKEYKVQLTVLVAPAPDCKPKIKRVENVLTTFLESADCGKPEGKAYFVQHYDISYENSTMAILYPGQESGTYTACVETPAIRCTRISKPSDLCTYFKIHTNTNQEGSSTTYAVIIFSVLVALCVAFGVLDHILLRFCQTPNVPSSLPLSRNPQNRPANDAVYTPVPN